MVNRKFALTVGINDYPGSGADLSGCVNDSNDIAAELDYRGYDTEQLLDSAATKAQILHSLERLVRITGYRDTLVFHYSGHGSWVPDYDGDEMDARDEVLCAHDYSSGGLISDDDLHNIFKHRRFGARIIVLSDSCHSGTISRAYSAAAKARYLSPQLFLPDTEYSMALSSFLPRRKLGEKSRTSAVLISGCSDLEYSYDAWFDNRANGAFTYHALKTINHYSVMNIKTWHEAIRRYLPSGSYPQTPQLSATWHQKYWKVL